MPGTDFLERVAEAYRSALAEASMAAQAPPITTTPTAVEQRALAGGTVKPWGGSILTQVQPALALVQPATVTDDIPSAEQLRELHDQGKVLAPAWQARLEAHFGTAGGALPERRPPAPRPNATVAPGAAPSGSAHFDRFRAWAPANGDAVQRARASEPKRGFDEQLMTLMADDEEAGGAHAPAVGDTREAELRAIAARKLMPVVPTHQYATILGTSMAGLAADNPESDGATVDGGEAAARGGAADGCARRQGAAHERPEDRPQERA